MQNRWLSFGSLELPESHRAPPVCLQADAGIFLVYAQYVLLSLCIYHLSLAVVTCADAAGAPESEEY